MGFENRGVELLQLTGVDSERCICSSKGSVNVFFERRNDAVRVEITDQQGQIEVVATPSAATPAVAGCSAY